MGVLVDEGYSIMGRLTSVQASGKCLVDVLE
jgi:hypothetical protein